MLRLLLITALALGLLVCPYNCMAATAAHGVGQASKCSCGHESCHRETIETTLPDQAEHPGDPSGGNDDCICPCDGAVSHSDGPQVKIFLDLSPYWVGVEAGDRIYPWSCWQFRTSDSSPLLAAVCGREVRALINSLLL